MANDFHLPEDLYFWGQDRLGSLVPMLANLLVRLFAVKAITAYSIVQYLLLLGVFFMMRIFIAHMFSRILFCFFLFIPFPFFMEQHYYSPQYFFLAICMFIYYRYYLGTFSFFKKLIYLFLCFIALSLAVWIAEFSVVFIACFLSVISLNYFLQEKMNKNTLNKIFNRKMFVSIGIIISALLIGYFFISYAKEHALARTPGYNILFGTFASFKFGLKMYCLFFVKSILFEYQNTFTGIHNILLLLITLYLFFSSVKKYLLKERTVGMKEIFLFNAVIGFILLLLSHYVQVNDFQPWYFTYAYMYFVMYIAFAIDSKRGKTRIILSGLYLMALFSMSFQSFRIEKDLHTNNPGNFSLDKIKKFKHIKDCGIIGDFWYSHILSINDPDSIPSTPNEIAYKNEKMIPAVFKKSKILIIQNSWLDSFPDSLFIFGHLLKRNGEPFVQESIHFCFYKKAIWNQNYNYKNVKFRESKIIKRFNGNDSCLLINPEEKDMHDFVVFGPYITLPESHYVLAVNFDSLTIKENDNMIIDVVENWGEKYFSKIEYKSGNYGNKKIYLSFTLTRKIKNAEFRIYLNGTSKFILRSMDLQQIPD